MHSSLNLTYFFYLKTPKGRSEYVHIKLSNFLQEFINEYNLTTHTCNGWVYFEITKRCYGLPQARKLANDLLHVQINKAGYYETGTTPGLWCPKWCPIIFGIIVHDFGIEYVGKRHAQQLIH